MTRPKLVLASAFVVALVASLGIWPPLHAKRAGGEGNVAKFLAAQLSSSRALAAESRSRTFGKFIAVGAGRDVSSGRFTDAQLRMLAEKFDIVRILKFHGHGDRRLHHEDARRLKELNPNIKVFAYFPASYRFKRDSFGRGPFRDEWVLRDVKGKPVMHRKERGTFVDLSNPAYRQWALDTIASWMRLAPYDGIHFDNSNPFENQGNPSNWRKNWVALLGPKKVEAWNRGLRDLLARAHDAVGPGKMVTYNGIAAGRWRPNRNLGLLEVADGAMNERFCFKRQTGVFSKKDMLEDIEILKNAAKNKKIIFEKVNVRRKEVDGEARLKLARYCLGVFALGYEPGYAFFKFDAGYPTALGGIEEDALEIDFPAGAPVAPFKTEGPIFIREFQKGLVYVNMETSPQRVRVPADLVLMNGGVPGKTYRMGEVFAIDRQDAAFFLKSRP